MGQKVALLGASENTERYAYKAFKMLVEYGHVPVPVNPTLRQIDGVAAVASLNEIQETVDTLCMYVNPEISKKLQSQVLRLNPPRVIFTPGSENPALAQVLKGRGIHVIEACTMVLLRTGQFEKA